MKYSRGKSKHNGVCNGMKGEVLERLNQIEACLSCIESLRLESLKNLHSLREDISHLSLMNGSSFRNQDQFKIDVHRRSDTDISSWREDRKKEPRNTSFLSSPSEEMTAPGTESQENAAIRSYNRRNENTGHESFDFHGVTLPLRKEYPLHDSRESQASPPPPNTYADFADKILRYRKRQAVQEEPQVHITSEYPFSSTRKPVDFADALLTDGKEESVRDKYLLPKVSGSAFPSADVTSNLSDTHLIEGKEQSLPKSSINSSSRGKPTDITDAHAAGKKVQSLQVEDGLPKYQSHQLPRSTENRREFSTLVVADNKDKESEEEINGIVSPSLRANTVKAAAQAGHPLQRDDDPASNRNGKSAYMGHMQLSPTEDRSTTPVIAKHDSAFFTMYDQTHPLSSIRSRRKVYYDPYYRKQERQGFGKNLEVSHKNGRIISFDRSVQDNRDRIDTDEDGIRSAETSRVQAAMLHSRQQSDGSKVAEPENSVLEAQNEGGLKQTGRYEQMIERNYPGPSSGRQHQEKFTLSQYQRISKDKIVDDSQAKQRDGQNDFALFTIQHDSKEEERTGTKDTDKEKKYSPSSDLIAVVEQLLKSNDTYRSSSDGEIPDGSSDRDILSHLEKGHQVKKKKRKVIRMQSNNEDIEGSSLSPLSAYTELYGIIEDLGKLIDKISSFLD